MILDTSVGGGARMAPDSVQAEQIVAETLAEKRLGTGAPRCTALRELESWSEGIIPAFVAEQTDCESEEGPRKWGRAEVGPC